MERKVINTPLNSCKVGDFVYCSFTDQSGVYKEDFGRITDVFTGKDQNYRFIVKLQSLGGYVNVPSACLSSAGRA